MKKDLVDIQEKAASMIREAGHKELLPAGPPGLVLLCHISVERRSTGLVT